MKFLFIACFAFICSAALCQDKPVEVAYNKLTELKGTPFIIASVAHYTKIAREQQYLLFINTQTAQSRQLSFAADAYLSTIEQLKIDSLGVNKVIISGKTVDLDGRKGIGWDDPQQLLLCDIDGSNLVKITDDNFFVRSYIMNQQTGVMVITGDVDSNNNKKLDKHDKAQLLLYDIRHMKLISRL